ncbi:MAG: hypothetical protein IH859_07095 [Chloroflexi bacterium]|nr:hypothetical protein [Chloroflexota bacterium]
MFEHPSYFIILTEVPGQIIDQFFLKDLPAFFNNLGISSIPNVQPRKLTAVFSESKWGNYPSLLQLVGICDGYHLTYPIPEIVDVKSALGYTPRWRLEDILQITFYGYLVIAEQLIPKVQGYPLDISEELILQHQALPIMKVYYPPSGYISSILTPLKIEAIAIILQQYIDLLEFDLNTFISPRTGLTLERILLADWIVKGDLPIFPRW